MQRQRAEQVLLGRVELHRHHIALAVDLPRTRVDLVAPGAQLRVEIVEAGEGAAGVEVSLDEVEGTLDPRRAIGVADGVSDEVEFEALAEREHLGGGDHVAARAVRADDGGVVDDAAAGGAAEVRDRLRQKRSALEAPEAPIRPREEPA